MRIYIPCDRILTCFQLAVSHVLFIDIAFCEDTVTTSVNSFTLCQQTELAMLILRNYLFAFSDRSK